MKPTWRKVYHEPKPAERESDIARLMRELPKTCHDFVQKHGVAQAAVAAALSGMDILGEARKYRETQ